jgi:hypothetical protein
MKGRGTDPWAPVRQDAPPASSASLVCRVKDLLLGSLRDGRFRHEEQSAAIRQIRVIAFHAVFLGRCDQPMRDVSGLL